MNEDNRTDYERFEDAIAFLGMKNKYTGIVFEISDSKNNHEYEFYLKDFNQLRDLIIKADNKLNIGNINNFITSVQSKVVSNNFSLDSNFGLKLS
ncbi:hypothetical protein [Cellulophaga baltica]|uniref:hypothetical protein n=1 Tax=Cellulophaga baltica TaxID=76594 RepID=UPI0015F64D9E|nr:hypothetical protein [Cellulophaga baltica]MBA6316941.1 hypothetical protein [Cellulophaga baltica]